MSTPSLLFQSDSKQALLCSQLLPLPFLHPVEIKPKGVFQTACGVGENRKECASSKEIQWLYVPQDHGWLAQGCPSGSGVAGTWMSLGIRICLLPASCTKWFGKAGLLPDSPNAIMFLSDAWNRQTAGHIFHL